MKRVTAVTAPVVARSWIAIAFVTVGLAASTQPADAESRCANQAIRAQLASAQLPDCRAYELVTPVAKQGWAPKLAGADGSRAVLKSLGGFAGSNQRTIVSVYVTDRLLGAGTEGEWRTSPFIEAPDLEISEATENLIDESRALDAGIFEAQQLEGALPGERNIYRRTLPSGVPLEVGPQFPPAILASARPGITDRATFPSVSSNLGSVLFEIAGPAPAENNGLNVLWPGDGTVTNTGPLDNGQGFLSLYEYNGVNQLAPTLVGLDANGHQISQCGTSLGLPAVSRTTPPESGFALPNPADVYNAISEDGSRVFFTAAKATQGPSGDACTGEGTGRGPAANELFARVSARSGSGHETRPISDPVPNAECTTSACLTAPPGDAAFQGASRDGSRVFFLSTRQLTDRASEDSAAEDSATSQAGCPGAAANNGCNLYEYDMNAPEGHNLTAVSAGDLSGSGPEVQGVVRVSEDGSHVYFVARGVLTNAANPLGAHPVAGGENLYVFDSHSDAIAFVATLSENDAIDWSAEDAGRPADATPDGRYLVFASSAALTPDDTSSVAQVFHYDALGQTLVRVSAGQDGFNEDGNTGEYAASIVSHAYRGWQNGAPELSSVTDNGGTVVFESSDALTPEAAPGSPHVYQYEGGTVSLLSPGQDVTAPPGSPATTHLLGIDGSGQDVFFETAAALVAQDGDTQTDIYDARVDGGFLPPAPTPCAGMTCQGALAPGPQLDTPQSDRTPQLEGAPSPPVLRSTPRTQPAKKLARCRSRLGKPAHGARHTSHKRCLKQKRRKTQSVASLRIGSRP